MILVAGSTGMLGSEICRQLIAHQERVRALVRKSSAPEKVNLLKQWGASLAEGDLKDPASLAKACEGCETVISTVSTTISRQEGDNIQSVDHDGQLHLVRAAKEAGVKHFIFISFRHQHAPDTILTAAKRSTEKAIIASGMNYTILQASIFMEIWLSPALGFNYPEHKVRVYGDGKNRVSYISYKDVASFAAGSIGNPAALNRVIEVGGPEAISQLDAVKLFEQAAGQSFILEFIPQFALEQQMKEAPDPMDRVFAGIMLMYAQGDEIDNKTALAAIPVSLHSVNEYAAAVMKKEVQLS